jgi:hypothetical protein
MVGRLVPRIVQRRHPPTSGAKAAKDRTIGSSNAASPYRPRRHAAVHLEAMLTKGRRTKKKTHTQ